MNNEQYRIIQNHDKREGNIHPTVIFGHNVKIGLNVIIEEGVYIGDDTLLCHNVLVRSNVKIGNKVELRAFVHVDPDAEIGDRTHVFPYGLVGGGWKIGKNVWYGPYTVTTNSSIPTKTNPSSIGDYSVIYSSCEIAPGITIAPGGVLGMGSVLTKSIGPLEMWWGNPAKLRKKVRKENLFISNDKPWPEELVNYADEEIYK